MSDLDMLRRAMLLDPFDDVARYAYLDEYEMTQGYRPVCMTEWEGKLDEFMRVARGLFELNPIRHVELKGCIAVGYSSDAGEYSDRWFVELAPWATRTRRYEYPEEFAPFMLGHVHETPRHAGQQGSGNETPGREYQYATEHSALYCTQRAALDYGRSLAGLPPLPPRA